MLEALKDEPAGSDLARARDILAKWNFRVVDDRRAARMTVGHTLLKAWLETAQKDVFSAVFPVEEARRYAGADPSFPTHGSKLLLNALQGAESGTRRFTAPRAAGRRPCRR